MRCLTVRWPCLTTRGRNVTHVAVAIVAVNLLVECGKKRVSYTIGTGVRKVYQGILAFGGNDSEFLFPSFLFLVLHFHARVVGTVVTIMPTRR